MNPRLLSMRTLTRAGMVITALVTWPGMTAQAGEGHPMTIVAANYPLAYFAERLGGEWVRVSLPVPADEDPAYWQPDSKTIQAMQQADLVALNGADYEQWLNLISLPRRKRVDTSAAFRSRYLVIKEAVTHSHGGSGTHSHDGTASTTWLDFSQAIQQSTALAAAIIRQRPDLQRTIEQNQTFLTADLLALDAAMQRVANQLHGQTVVASHPVYQYLARRYGLNLESVHWEPQEMPPAAEWIALRERLSRHPAQLMVWEDTPSNGIRQALTGLKLKPVDFLPCANRPRHGNFLSVMRANIANLEATITSPQNTQTQKPRNSKGSSQ